MTQPGSFQPLWIDEPDAGRRLQCLGLAEPLKGDLERFVRDGYTIMPGVLSHEDADRIIADAHAIYTTPERYVVRDKGTYADPTSVKKLDRGHRIIDLYALSSTAREVIFAPRVSALLQAAFSEPAIAIQSLYFEHGSQQGIHQDTAYVVARGRPTALTAIWIALEDVQEGAGELIYYTGGHRIPPYLFGGNRYHFIPQKDGQEEHRKFLDQLHVKAKERGLRKDRFLAKKGDVLIWHAELPHGGERITRNTTRRSLVVHYVPKSVKANYINTIGPNYCELPAPNGNAFTSRHFRLSEMNAEGWAPILFDGGARER